MRIWNEYLTLNTKKQREFVNITAEVKAAVAKSGIREGIILVSTLHCNAGVYLNGDDPGLFQDIDECLEKLAPFRPDHKLRGQQSNASAYLKSLLLHPQVVVPLADGKFDFGPWQEIVYAEFDGQRPKRLLIKVMGE
jgi:secondary thiamine-phosphate synthase enzyme